MKNYLELTEKCKFSFIQQIRIVNFLHKIIISASIDCSMLMFSTNFWMPLLLPWLSTQALELVRGAVLKGDGQALLRNAQETNLSLLATAAVVVVVVRVANDFDDAPPTLASLAQSVNLFYLYKTQLKYVSFTKND